MGQPFIGEIRMFAGNFPPVGWAFCNGQLVPISENDALFTLIGTTYGGDGQETFALPDLRGRVPIHQGNNFVIGENGGVESVTVTVQQIPTHSHVPLATTAGQQLSPSSSTVIASSTSSQAGTQIFGTTNNTNLSPASVGPTGGSQPHNNLQPYLAIQYIISLFGLFPQFN